MIGMDEGARRANAELRSQGEKRDRETTIELLREIRDSLVHIEEFIAPRIGWISPNEGRVLVFPVEEGDLAFPELPPSDEGELLEKNES